MKTNSRRVFAAVLALAVVGSVAAASAGTPTAHADPAALKALKRMTDYLAGLESFSMHTANSYEDVLESGQKIQFNFSSSVVIDRPNKLRAERTDGMVRQLLIYDGATLAVYEGSHDLYATVATPDNLDALLHFARDALDLVPPVGDLVFTNAFDLLTAGVTSGMVVGKAVIGGVSCDHLAFTTPVVDWQVWVADGDKPLPYKYVLTTRDDPAQPQFISVISDWNTDPVIPEGAFGFTAPPTATKTEFVRIDVGHTTGQ